ncbi:hypothetical protein KSS87_017063 [Heliosperma pusillum]|nr:hypothetical protein KSS87_004348 [Heliosperma pusillum]KAH9612531.1 hypothetical protein KSS87_017063 [Heliosperma pusillum]
MQSMSKTTTNCETNDGIKDRLRHMLDQVIVHILSLMPTLDAFSFDFIQVFCVLSSLSKMCGYPIQFRKKKKRKIIGNEIWPSC